MKNSQLNRAIKLARRTGDRLVIMDNESESVLVLMDIDAYERMLGAQSAELENLSEEEMMEKINRDIARWRSYNEENAAAPENDIPVIDEPEELVTEAVAPEMGFSSEKIEPIDITGGAPEEPLTLPPELEPEANFGQDMGKIDLEEPLNDVPEEEEEKFYLEPVE